MLSKSFPSWLRAHLRKRYLLPILAFGGPLVAIALVQYRWLEELRTRSTMIESHRNRQSALAAVSMLEDAMSGARLDTLPAVVHADVLELKLDALAREFDEGLERYPYVERFFVWIPPAPPGGSLFYFPEERRFCQAPEMVAFMPLQVWGIDADTLRWSEFPSLPGHPPYQIVIHRLLNDDDSSLEGIVGFVVDLSTFAGDYLPSFHAGSILPLLLTTLGKEETPVAIFDEKGEPVFSAGGSGAAPRSDSSVEFHLSFASPVEGPPGISHMPHWRLSVGEANADGVQNLLVQGALGNLAIVAAGILVLAWGTVLIARTSARESQLSDLKSRFISGISHELKTPLSLIRLYSEMLELGRVPDAMERKVFYRTLRQQAEALGDTVEQILDFSRLEAEQPQPKKPCSPKEILEEAMEMLAISRPERTVMLSLESDLPELECDRHGLVRVIYNLLDNAAKYSLPDQPIEMNATHHDGLLGVVITDHGTGISAEELPHVFDRFYRARSARDIKGTGLGLAIADAVVKAHQGRIEVESRPGEGSRFSVILPLSSKRHRV